jgi:AraC-like DNA-binding protein
MAEIHTSLRETHTIGGETRERILSARLLPGLARRGINLAGLSEARSPFAFHRPSPSFGHVLVCLSGRGEVFENEQWVSCTAGMAYLTPPGMLHGYRAARDGGIWEIAWVHCRAPGRDGQIPEGRAMASAAAAALLPVTAALRAPATAAVNPVPLATTLEAMYAEYSSATPDAEILDDWAALLAAQTQRIARIPAVGAEPDVRLRRLWTTVHAGLARPWCVTDLAEEAGVSDEQLRRLCQQYLGRSPMQQVTHLRMRHAASLLASGAYTVEAVAHAVGYDNPFAFSTAFKRHMGAPPSTFREPRRAGYNTPSDHDLPPMPSPASLT